METWSGNNVVFQAYFEGKWKKPTKSTRNKDNYLSFEAASKYPCFGAILSPGFVDISFDSKEMYEAFISMAEANDWRCLCLPSTKGGHTYWRNTNKKIAKGGESKKLAVGLVADIHHGATYIPLRVYGVNPNDSSDVRNEERFPPDYDVWDGEDYQEVPEELLPVNTKENLWMMSDGDGRNECLYSYILTLQSQLQLDDDTIRRILTNTSDFVFSQPLDKNELDVILRDEAFQKPSFFNGSTFLFDRFAEYLKSSSHIVKINEQLHIFKDGIYANGYRQIETEMIKTIPNLKKTQRREVLDYLELIAEPLEMADARYIAFRNGIYDVLSNTMQPFTPDIVITNQIPWDYVPDAYNTLADNTLNKLACGNKAIRMLLEECIGYCFYRRNELRKAFFLTGGKANGKSTFLALVKVILGDGNVSALDLKEMGDRFSTAMMFGKLANIGDDISDDFLQGAQVATFKKVVTGERIKAERKGQDPFEFNPYIKLLFSANDIPRMKDKTGAVLSRLEIIPFNASFTKDDPDYDPFIKYKLIQQDSIEYLIRLGIEGLRRVLTDDRGFTVCEQVQQQLKEYEEENNPIIAFIADQGVEMIENEPTADVYKRYQVFCAENNMNPMSNIVFSKQINKRLCLEVVLKKVSGKVYKIFRKI